MEPLMQSEQALHVPLDLQQSEARLRRVLQSTGAIAYELDAATGRVDVVGDTQAIVGYDPEDAATWWHECIHPDDLAHAAVAFAAAVERGEDQYTAEYRLRHRDGSERYAWNRSIIVRDETGQVIRLLGTTVDITERKRREERARQLQELTAALSAALDPESVGAAIIERAMPAVGANAGNVFLVDDSTRELRNVAVLGYEPEIAQWARRLPLDGPTLVAEVARTGEPILLATWEERIARYPHHRRVHAKGGDRAVAGLPLQVEGRTIGALSLAFPSDRAFDDDDRRFMATVADLCAQALQRAELYEALRRGEERLELAQEAGQMGSWLLTLPKKDLSCSARCKANFGLPPEADLSYRDLIAAVVPQDREQARKTIKQAISDGGDYDTRYRVRWPDGSVHWIMARGRVLRNVDGTPVSMIGVTVDVTTYQHAEEELRRQAALLDQAYDAMFAWEWTGPITYWNKGAERMYGYTADEAVGRLSHELLGTTHGGGPSRLLQRLMQHGVDESEAEHTSKDGRRLVVESRHQVVVDAGQRYVLEANRDITERRRREERAARLQELAAALAGALDPEM